MECGVLAYCLEFGLLPEGISIEPCQVQYEAGHTQTRLSDMNNYLLTCAKHVTKQVTKISQALYFGFRACLDSKLGNICQVHCSAENDRLLCHVLLHGVKRVPVSLGEGGRGRGRGRWLTSTRQS